MTFWVEPSWTILLDSARLTHASMIWYWSLRHLYFWGLAGCQGDTTDQACVSPAGQPKFIHTEVLQGPRRSAEVCKASWSPAPQLTLCSFCHVTWQSKFQGQELQTHITKTKDKGRGKITVILQSNIGARDNLGKWEYSGEQNRHDPCLLGAYSLYT